MHIPTSSTTIIEYYDVASARHITGVGFIRFRQVFFCFLPIWVFRFIICFYIYISHLFLLFSICSSCQGKYLPACSNYLTLDDFCATPKRLLPKFDAVERCPINVTLVDCFYCCFCLLINCSRPHDKVILHCTSSI